MTLIIKKVKESIASSVKTMLEELSYIPQKDKIFIKPNIALPTWPSSPYITNPQVVAGIIDYLHEKGFGDIVIGEGPVPIDFPVEETFAVSGYRDMCMEKGVTMLNLDLVPGKKINDLISLPGIVFEREYINVSKLKTHYQTTVSLGLKNQKGLLSPGNKNLFHRNLHRNIAELASVINPSLSVIDASNGLEGNGPADLGHEVEDLNLLLGGTGFLALDQLACKVIGIAPSHVKHLAIAEEKGCFRSLKDEIIKGETLEKIRHPFEIPSLYWKKGHIYYYWSDYTCSRCSVLEGKIIEKIDELPLELLDKLPLTAFITGPPKTHIPENVNVYGIGKCASMYNRRLINTPPVICPPDIDDFLNILSFLLIQ